MSNTDMTALLKQGEAESLRRQKIVNTRSSVVVWAAAAITVGVLVALIAYILIMGIPNLSPKLFEWEYTTENVSMMPAIINTIVMTILSLLLAVPVGIFSAIYLVEYARRGISWCLWSARRQRPCQVSRPSYTACSDT